jgi:hypothetical protein
METCNPISSADTLGIERGGLRTDGLIATAPNLPHMRSCSPALGWPERKGVKKAAHQGPA